MFKVGDEVVCLVKGKINLVKGVVLSTNPSEKYSILIRSEEKEDRTYTNTLFHKGTTFTVNEAPEPKRLPDLKVDDLVWVWAFNKEDKIIRCFSHFSEKGHLHTFDSGYSSHKESDYTTWWENYEVYEK